MEFNRCLGLVGGVESVAGLGLVVVVSMVGGLRYVARFWWWVISLFIVCGATVVGLVAVVVGLGFWL